MGVHVIDEANRCLNCKKPLCRQGCPINTPIPQMIQAFKGGDLNAAGDMVFENNPLSIVCSLVCNHEKQCEGHCILGKKGQPVHISSIENYISDTIFDKMKIECKPKNGKKVAVIGAGPAGITIAFLLTKEGYSVTIFDSKDKLGGVLQYGIPEFRLPKTILERYKKKLLEMTQLNSSSDVKVGSEVVTSGLDGVSVKDVPIGKVESVIDYEGNRTILVKPYADFDKISYVTLVGEGK